jgi:hypothetical protein
MISIDTLLGVNKDNACETAEILETHDIEFLVKLLAEKDDKIRYPALLLLLSRSAISSDVCAYWDVFSEKLKSDNSYQRSIGMMLIAENARWDKSGRLDDMLDDYFALFHDEKPITIRQSIQALKSILPYKPHLASRIASALMKIDLAGIRETMRKLILVDILEILADIRKHIANDEIEAYIMDALTGGLLDKKAKACISGLL